MTRINCIPVSELHSKHLIAEYRELPRVFPLVRRAIERGEEPNLLGSYTLGKGHVRFFYPRLLWLSLRHIQLVNEMFNRNFNPHFRENLRVSFIDIPSDWYNDWEPDQKDIKLNRSRISQRLIDMGNRHE